MVEEEDEVDRRPMEEEETVPVRVPEDPVPFPYPTLQAVHSGRQQIPGLTLDRAPYGPDYLGSPTGLVGRRVGGAEGESQSSRPSRRDTESWTVGYK